MHYFKSDLWKLIRYILFVLVLNSCSYSIIRNQNVAYLYNEKYHKQHSIQYLIYHFHQDSTRLYAKIPLQMLTFELQTWGKLKAEYAMKYILRDFENNAILDSNTIYKEYMKEGNFPEDFITTVDFNTPVSQKYIFEIRFYDIYGVQEQYNNIVIDKSNSYKRQHFMAVSVDESRPLFKNYTSGREKILLKYADKNIDTLYVKHYKYKFKPALPPFADVYSEVIKKERWDSSFTILISDTLQLQQEGFYHFQTNTLVDDGFTFYRFTDHYPKIKDVELLISSLRYITKNKEYKDLINASNKKLKVDSFWLKNSGSIERARTILRTYYTRVEQANDYFTSYKEGWETDRGIIFIIYGTPATVYKSTNDEVWIYERQLDASFLLKFIFEKRDNSFSDNDFFLRRDSYYEASWHNAVQKWRHGRISNIDN